VRQGRQWWQWWQWWQWRSGGCAALRSGGCAALRSGGCAALRSGGCAALRSGGSAALRSGCRDSVSGHSAQVGWVPGRAFGDHTVMISQECGTLWGRSAPVSGTFPAFR